MRPVASPFSLSLAALLVLAACDPLVGVHASISLPPDALASYAGNFPAQVLVTDDHDTHQIGAPPHAHRIAVLCQKSDAAQQLQYSRGGIGCAEETHLVAYVAPLPPAEAGETCGPLAEAKFVDAPPPISRPSGRATLFAGMKGECGSHEASTAITIVASP
jgi:hypothetical protein